MHIENLVSFRESISIASACKKILRKLFLQPDIIGLIPTGGYTCNHNYSKKAFKWLLHMEQGVGVKIMHVRNCRENRLPELPHIIIDGYSPETRKLYEFFGCYFHGNTCQAFIYVIILNGDTLAQRYERTMSRLEQSYGRAIWLKFNGNVSLTILGNPNCSRCYRIHCGPVMLWTRFEPRPCVSTLRHGRTRLFNI